MLSYLHDRTCLDSYGPCDCGAPLDMPTVRVSAMVAVVVYGNITDSQPRGIPEYILNPIIEEHRGKSVDCNKYCLMYSTHSAYLIGIHLFCRQLSLANFQT